MRTIIAINLVELDLRVNQPRLTNKKNQILREKSLEKFQHKVIEGSKEVQREQGMY